jgi:exocyst complex component 3
MTILNLSDWHTIAVNLQNMEMNYMEWMQKTLETEKLDWGNGTAPEGDDQGFFHTSAPVIIFQMIDQNLQVTRTIR